MLSFLHAELATLHVSIPNAIFGTVLAIHIFAGITCVITGAIAALAAKRPGRHPRFGTIYYWTFGVAFASLAVLSAMRWYRD